jgi:hypothetical protein
MEPLPPEDGVRGQSLESGQVARKFGKKFPREARALLLVLGIGLGMTVLQFFIVEKMDSKVVTH